MFYSKGKGKRFLFDWGAGESEVYLLNPRWALFERCVYDGGVCPNFFEKVITSERVVER